MLKSVVFPAPFGPMRPVIAPLAMMQETSVTALTPSKCLDTPLTSSIVRTFPLRWMGVERVFAEQSLRAVHHAENEEHAVQYLPHVGGDGVGEADEAEDFRESDKKSGSDD